MYSLENENVKPYYNPCLYSKQNFIYKALERLGVSLIDEKLLQRAKIDKNFANIRNLPDVQKLLLSQ